MTTSVTRTVITGADGMLGKAVHREAKARGIDVFALSHKQADIGLPILAHFRPDDVVINCAGVRSGTAGPRAMIRANAIGPHNLQEAIERDGARLIHVSTDCVFSGPGPHSTDELPTPPNDLYARSKLAGEVYGPNSTTVRTSFVGPEHGLWRWVAEHPPGPIECWVSAWWSGSLVSLVAARLMDMALRPREAPLIHLATESAINKAAAVAAIAHHLHRTDLKWEPTTEPRIDRRLVPTPGWELPPLEQYLV